MKFIVGYLMVVATLASADGMDYFSAQWNLENIEGEILINDCPVSRKSGGGTASVNHWILNGDNRVELRIRKALGPDAFASFQLSAGKLAAPDKLEERKKLTINWKPTGTMKYPVLIERQDNLQSSLGKPLWESGKQLEDNEATRKEAFAVVEQLYAAMKAGDIPAWMKIIEDSAQWLASLYGKNDGSQSAQKTWTKIIGKGIDLGTPKFEELNFQFICNHRLVEVTKKSGGSAVQIKGKNSTTSLPVTLGKVDTTWKSMGP